MSVRLSTTRFPFAWASGFKAGVLPRRDGSSRGIKTGGTAESRLVLIRLPGSAVDVRVAWASSRGADF